MSSTRAEDAVPAFREIEFWLRRLLLLESSGGLLPFEEPEASF